MQKVYKFLIIVTSLLLFGCGNEIAKLPRFDGPKQQADQSLVVVKLDNFDYLDITRIEEPVDKDSKPLQYRIMKTPRLLLTTYTKSLYTIEPGTYYISFIAIDSDKGVYYSAAPGIDAQGKIAYGAFKIHPGDVVYLGDIECRWQSTNKIKKILQLDKLAEVKRDLNSAGKGDLASKIVPVKLYSSGTSIQAIN